MHYYKFNIADWSLHTGHLSVEEEAVYFRLINHYYDTEVPIPKITQPVIRRLRLGEHAELVAIILEEFFTLIGDLWHHKRCDLEISAYHAKAETNQANGKKGGRPKGSKKESKPPKKPKITQSVNSGNPDVTLTKNQEPLTTNQEPDKGKQLSVKPDQVADIYDYWVEVMGKAQSSTKLTPKRKKAIQARLADGYTPSQIKTAILNCKKDPWSMGANDRNTPFNDLELICRSGEKLESFIDKETGGSHAQNRFAGNAAKCGRKLTPAEQVIARKAARYGGDAAREPSDLGAVVAVQ